MAPVSSAATAPASTGSTGPSVASAAPRLTPAQPTAPVAGRSTGANMAALLSAASPGGQTNLPQNVSAQALLTLLQALGKPLAGTVGRMTQGLTQTGGASGTPAPGSAGGMPVTVTMPQVASMGAAGAPVQISTVLPLPAGTSAPPAGTPILLEAEGSAQVPRLAVTVTDSAPISQQSLRSDAARQSSLAPLLADIAKLIGQPSLPRGVDAALGRILGLTLDADAPLDGAKLKAVVEGGRGGMPMPASSTGGQPQPSMQTALGALIRALGLSLPKGEQPQPPAQSVSQAGGQTAPGQQAQAQGKALPLPVGAQPSRLLAHALPDQMPDLSDPATIQALKTKAESALSRLNLLQAGDMAGSTRGSEAMTGLRWDIPLLIGQEAALLGVMIEGDGGSDRERERRERNWRFRFAFESQSLGDVEGLVALHGSAEQQGEDPHLDIAVWASEPTIRARLDAMRGDLIARLKAAGMQIDSLTIAALDSLPDVHPTPDHDVLHRVDVSS